MGFFQSLFGGGNADAPDVQPLLNFYNSQYNGRLADINNFSQQLDSYNASYTNALGNLYNTAYARHAANLSAAYGAKGIDTNSGAFAAELARASTEMSAQMAPQTYQNAIGAANTVQGYKASAYNNYTSSVGGVLGQSVFDKYNRQNTLDDRFSQSMGSLLGSAVGNFSNGAMGGNPFSQAGAAMTGQPGNISQMDMMKYMQSEAGTAKMNAGNSLFM